jgi:hypothetical protein
VAEIVLVADAGSPSPRERERAGVRGCMRRSQLKRGKEVRGGEYSFGFLTKPLSVERS